MGGEDPRIVLEWLRAATTGGVHRVERGGTRFAPWSEVLGDVERGAAHLRERGIAPRARVGVRGDNSYEWLVLDLALLELGAVPVAIPVPDFKGRPNSEVARTYGLVAVFAAKAARSADDGPAVAPLEDLLELPGFTPDADPPAPLGKRLPEDDREVFTLAFSSGTAGRVKCLLLAWRGVEALVRAQGAAYPMTPEDRVLIALPLSTFQQRYLCYLAIRNACGIVLTTASRFLAALEQGRPTILLGPPNFYEFAHSRYEKLPPHEREALDRAVEPADSLPREEALRLRREVFRSFHDSYGGRARLMLVGSAPVRPEMLEFFARAGFELYQIYGMTEIGYLTWNLPGDNRIGSVGRENQPGSVRIAPDGEVLVTHDVHLCVGYEGEEPEDVEQVFRGPRTIATGDLGEFVDGHLFLKGRKKNVVITSGGEKLQIEDLEFDIAKAGGVNRVALYPAPDGDGYAAAVWYDGDREAARDAVRPRIGLVSSRLGAGRRISRIALRPGELTPESPLLNRNLKVNRDAVRVATSAALEPLDA
ncbi:AMP-binding protein [Actinosynnema sp.]|uniref:AMP-binding protein n=1 Tax=Actinosynnema sp. TaxID=1872144 RepID=UPI003F82AE5A